MLSVPQNNVMDLDNLLYRFESIYSRTTSIWGNYDLLKVTIRLPSSEQRDLAENCDDATLVSLDLLHVLEHVPSVNFLKRNDHAPKSKCAIFLIYAHKRKFWEIK